MNAMNPVPQIVTYQTKANGVAPFRSFFCKDGVMLPVYIDGATEHESITKANQFWIDAQAGTLKPVATTPQARVEFAMPKPVDGRHGLTGKVWVVSRKGGKRIDPSEVNEYLSKGYKLGKKWK